MHSVLISLDYITIYSYGVCLAMGIILVYFAMTSLERYSGFNSDFVSTLLTILIVTGLFGARLFYVVEHWDYYSGSPSKIWRVQEGGLMFYGGLLISSAVLIFYCRLKKRSIGDVLDLIASTVPLGQALGRIGCFLNGCCYGKASNCSIAVSYPKNSIPWIEQLQDNMISESAARSLPVLPSQLFEAALALLIFAVLYFSYKRRVHRGMQVARYMILYGVARFIIEFSRADERLHFGFFSISQVISIGLIIGGAVICLYLRTKPADYIAENPR